MFPAAVEGLPILSVLLITSQLSILPNAVFNPVDSRFVLCAVGSVIPVSEKQLLN